jgi:hypothetical protein
MASANIFTKKTEVRDKLDGMIKRGGSSESFLARVAYPLYQARQSKRWITEGASEGVKWAPLNAKYADWKRRQFAGFPANGEKMLIATGRLAESVIGRQLKGDAESTEIVVDDKGKSKMVLSGSLGGGGMKDHKVLVTKRSLVVESLVEYSSQVNAKRPIWKFNDDFFKRLRAAYKGWFTTGQVRVKA